MSILQTKALLDSHGCDEVDLDRCPLDKLILFTAIVGRHRIMSAADLQGAVSGFLMAIHRLSHISIFQWAAFFSITPVLLSCLLCLRFATLTYRLDLEKSVRIISLSPPLLLHFNCKDIVVMQGQRSDDEVSQRLTQAMSAQVIPQTIN